jgi:mono/diheme cytochrome c family protein
MHRETRRPTERDAAAAWIAAGLFLLASAIPAAAEEPGQAAERGALLFRIHCASCHGQSATGDGPVAEVLEVQPADLTVLAASHDGDFPSDEIRRSIDGREDLAAHGRREMPVWGLSFQERGRDTDQEEEVRGRIDDLLAYLRTIQRSEEDPPPSGGDGEAGAS